MQPVQDLTVEDRVSRTQFQYSLEDADPNELATWVPRFVARLRKLPELARRRPATSRTTACRPTSSSTATPRRGSASRRRCSTTRSTTPSASARSRPCSPSSTSTAWCWRPSPEFHQSPQDLDEHLPALDHRRLGAARRLHARRGDATTPLAVNHQGQFPVVTVSFNLAPGASLGEAVKAIDQAQGRTRACRPASRPSFQGTAAGVPGVARATSRS